MDQLSRHEKRTILLCTHHLEDAEKLCKRVMIMNRGKTVIVGTPDELRKKISGQPVVQITLETLNKDIIDAVKSSIQTRDVSVVKDNNSLLISVDDAKVATPEIVREIVKHGGSIFSVNEVRPSLEEAYLKLIGGTNN